MLKVIFEANLRLFGKKSKKKVLFVLRDFTDEDNREMITQRINNKISEIWKEIHKPEDLKDTVAKDFFDFEFYLLPHKTFE